MKGPRIRISGDFVSTDTKNTKNEKLPDKVSLVEAGSIGWSLRHSGLVCEVGGSIEGHAEGVPRQPRTNGCGYRGGASVIGQKKVNPLRMPGVGQVESFRRTRTKELDPNGLSLLPNLVIRVNCQGQKAESIEVTHEGKVLVKKVGLRMGSTYVA